MKTNLRTALVPAFLLAIVSTGCQSDVKPVGDVLATDSTLALEVFGAKPDSVIEVGDTAESTEPAAIEATEPSTVPADLAVTPAPATPVAAAGTSVTTEPRRAVVKTASRTVSRATATRRIRRQAAVSTRARRSTTQSSRATTSTSTVTSATSSAGTPSSTVGTAVPSRAWLVIPAGAQLEFEADEQICSSGDGFEATLSEGVLIGDGTVIPGGASAKGAVVTTASNGDGASPGMSIDWLTFDGRTYKVSTRVKSAATKKIRTRSARTSATTVAAGAGIGAAAGGMIGRDVGSTIIGAASGAIAGAVAGRRGASYTSCVPDGGRIVAELTKPLRVLMTD